MAEVKYKYAFIDEDKDVLISIDDITKENRNKYKYRCVSCGRELLPRAIDSKYKKAHFYHKEELECSGETYLHKLAKHIIKEKFYSMPEFFVEYPVRDCNKEECKYRNSYCQEIDSQFRIDLKKYYDTCTEESLINGYVADILLTNSKKPQVDPTLIEVCVSHPCDEKKRNSGLRIIEIKIRDEKDVIDLQQASTICELGYASKRERTVEFISFKRMIKNPKQVKIQRYVFNPKNNLNGFLTEIECNKAQLKLQTDSEVELNLVNKKGYTKCEKWDVWQWMAIHKGLRRCNLCKFYYATQYEEFPICRLSKKYGKPVRPSMEEAENCKSYNFKDMVSPFYRLDAFYIEEV